LARIEIVWGRCPLNGCLPQRARSGDPAHNCMPRTDRHHPLPANAPMFPLPDHTIPTSQYPTINGCTSADASVQPDIARHVYYSRSPCLPKPYSCDARSYALIGASSHTSALLRVGAALEESGLFPVLTFSAHRGVRAGVNLTVPRPASGVKGHDRAGATLSAPFTRAAGPWSRSVIAS
jgi:hypothetical protein